MGYWFDIYIAGTTINNEMNQVLKYFRKLDAMKQ